MSEDNHDATGEVNVPCSAAHCDNCIAVNEYYELVEYECMDCGNLFCWDCYFECPRTGASHYSLCDNCYNSMIEEEKDLPCELCNADTEVCCHYECFNGHRYCGVCIDELEYEDEPDKLERPICKSCDSCTVCGLHFYRDKAIQTICSRCTKNLLV